MPVRRLFPLVVLAAVVAGCGGADPEPTATSAAATEPVRGLLALDRAPAGAPDGGTAAGHRGGGYEADIEGGELAFSVRLRPADARLAVGGARSSITIRPGGLRVVRLSAIERGLTVTLAASAPGRRAWREEVRVGVVRTDGPTRREPQGAEPNRGPPGNADAAGGRLDVDIRDFAFSPARLELRTGGQVVWRNQDRAEHALRPVSGPDGAVLPRSGRLRAGDRFDLTTLEPGTYRYVCTIHSWMEGELVASAR